MTMLNKLKKHTSSLPTLKSNASSKILNNKKQTSISGVSNAVLIKDSGRTSGLDDVTEQNSPVDSGTIMEETDTDSEDSSPEVQVQKKKERRMK